MKSPFKFLDPYELKDRAAFFGREAEIKELYGLVTKNRLTFVYGPSGTGKTSLVQCGLASCFGGVDWLPIFVRRGDDLNASLRREIEKALGGGPFEGSLADAIATLFNRYLRPIYLVFDQFEELFILGRGDAESAERAPFYESVATLLDAELPCRLLFILREDYFGHLNQFEQVVPELYNRKLRVEPMRRDNLRAVLRGSCQVHGIGFDDPAATPDRILDNILADKNAVHMPYVQVYLHMLYQEALRQQAPHAGEAAPPDLRFDAPVVEAVGPIADVLGNFLKEQEISILRTLTEQNGTAPPEDLVRRVLDAFVTEEGTKIPLAYTLDAQGLPQLLGKTARPLAALPPALVADALRELEKSRILRRSDDDYEIAHDTLAALVDQQRSAEQRQRLEIRRRIETGYREHRDSGGTYYFDEGQLARIEPFLDKISLEPEWTDFLSASRADFEARRQAEEARLARELRLAVDKYNAELLAKQRQRRLSLILLGVALLAVAAMGFAYLKWRDAEQRKREAEQALCDTYQERLTRYTSAREQLRLDVAAFRKAGETANEQLKIKELQRLDSLRSDLERRIAGCK
jgi:hypothetical protein